LTCCVARSPRPPADRRQLHRWWEITKSQDLEPAEKGPDGPCTGAISTALGFLSLVSIKSSAVLSNGQNGPRTPAPGQSHLICPTPPGAFGNAGRENERASCHTGRTAFAGQDRCSEFRCDCPDTGPRWHEDHTHGGPKGEPNSCRRKALSFTPSLQTPTNTHKPTWWEQ
jgi:hypothetical protein